MADYSTAEPLVCEEPQYDNDYETTSNWARQYAPEEPPWFPGQDECSAVNYSEMPTGGQCEAPAKPGVNGPAVADAILKLMGFWR